MGAVRQGRTTRFNCTLKFKGRMCGARQTDLIERRYKTSGKRKGGGAVSQGGVAARASQSLQLIKPMKAFSELSLKAVLMR
jgi:hypothetical protein